MNVLPDYSHHPFYHFAKSTAGVIFRLLLRIKVIDMHNVPLEGPVILSSNHIQNFDPPLLGVLVPRYVHFMAKSELFENKIANWGMLRLGAFPVKRGSQDMAAIKYAVRVPANGGCLAVFPEGHRSKDGKLGQAMTGVAFIARKANCPIVPVAIIGPYRLFRPLTIRFGIPFYPAPDDTNETLLLRTMTNIETLLHKGHQGR